MVEQSHIILTNHLLIISALTSCVLSIIAIIFALKAAIEVRALQKSTHSVSWMPVEAGKSWGDEDKKIKEINKESKDFYTESGF